MNKGLDAVARETVFAPLGLNSTFSASPENVKLKRFESRMAAGYDEKGLPIPGKFPPTPDLAASGLWSTPRKLLAVGKEFVAAFSGRSAFLRQASAREMAKPVDGFPWTGLGLLIGGKDTLISQGWGENGQCMMKMNCRTGEISVVMTNRNPGADQAESGVQWLADRRFSGGT